MLSLRPCPVCGKYSECHGTRAATRRQYCSFECRKIAKRVTLTCETCERSYETYKRLVRNEHHFCSRMCQYQYSKIQPQKALNAVGRCPICDKEFRYRKGTEKTYCGEACYRVAYREKKVGVFAQGGNKGHSIRTAARRHLPKECAICGWNITSCDAHHIDPVRKNGHNGLTNIIILCPNHHRMAERRLITTEQLHEYWQFAYGELNLPSSYR